MLRTLKLAPFGSVPSLSPELILVNRAGASAPLILTLWKVKKGPKHVVLC